MKLQTKIPIESETPKIDYDSKIVLVGSCFVESIGDKLDYLKFQTLQNPFGILFHPIAIERIIERALESNFFTESDIFFKNERWHCFELHSSVCATTKIDFLSLINNKLKELREYLITASHVVLTFGTSWVYRFLKTKKIVANCFKIPQKEFQKELLSIEEIKTSYNNIVTQILSRNPDTQIITTISPVRHVKEGIIENNRSKAHLITALQQLVFEEKKVCYFPSYELMIDQLRDYRFYKEDMIHPNGTAIKIIWEFFKKTWISKETESIQKSIRTIRSGLDHQPFDPTSKQHQLFLQDLKTKMNQVEKEFSHIKF
jgi:hypothetical protein